MKKFFKSGTPSFVQFVNKMRQESKDQQKNAENYMNQAAVKRGKFDEYCGNFIYEQPPCFAKWEPSSSKNKISTE